MSSSFFSKRLGIYCFEVYPQGAPFETCHLHQVHSRRIVSIQQASPTTQADGLYGLGHLPRPLMVKTADCLPVALVGNEGAALLHVGWRGLRDGIAQHPSLALIDPISFFVGPHICGEHFEVSREFRGHFPHSRHFFWRGQKLFFSLYRELEDQIGHLYPKASVEDGHWCTFGEEGLHSFRRDKTSLRNENVLRIPQKGGIL